MSVRSVLSRPGLRRVRRPLLDAKIWYGLMRSRNKEFIRYAPPGHFYSPIPDIDHIRSNAGRVFDRSVDDIPGVVLHEEGQLRLLADFAEHYPEMPFAEHPSESCRYHLDNPFYSYGDGVVLYSMMRVFRPRRIVEVGSGFSSAAMLEVDDRFFDGNLELTFIDPYPERLLGLLSEADRTRCAVLRQPVQEVPDDVFTSLEAGDFLFIDSSHLAKADSDVLHLLFRILPLLRSGVIVHVHDVMWPFEYPSGWLEQGRAWNEAYFLRAFLQYNEAFSIVYFNSYMAHKHAGAVTEALPLAMCAPSARNTMGNASLWLRKA
ncbi:class I SAM-dependent methyltransferase [Pseudonocardia sp.]|uniref:class I SAM-dependent methyltransferase n=1 Tax=Pseudonocardia sp. TaxID=60912 RepID=UPI002612B942|nr:class I SAM-dependent methyltransferase [Pseudonocardia sp.]